MIEQMKPSGVDYLGNIPATWTAKRFKYCAQICNGGEYADIERFKTERTDLGMLRLVLRERQREFAFEGKRWFDLVRYALYTSTDGTTEKMFNDTEMLKNKYTSNESQYRAKMATIKSLFFPIAEREMNANSLLVQNDAYKVEDKVQKN